MNASSVRRRERAAAILTANESFLDGRPLRERVRLDRRRQQRLRERDDLRVERTGLRELVARARWREERGGTG